ncbi:hypothetical protein [Pandoraea soli]|uniref:hypothetical protein n=1 Tax=Pandoraea soli TaxID=2508293 RepID=UPI00124170D6|nr:hypothetical protein [Pandoraea soli]
MPGKYDDLPRPPGYLLRQVFPYRQKSAIQAISAIIDRRKAAGWWIPADDGADRVPAYRVSWLTY